MGCDGSDIVYLVVYVWHPYRVTGLLPIAHSNTGRSCFVEPDGRRWRPLFNGLQLFARLKANRFPRRNVDFRAGAGIAPNSGLSRANREDTKAAQFDAVALGKR